MPEIEGLPELFKILDNMEKATSGKILAQSLKAASKPTYLEIKAAAPVGKKAHRTYRGRLVSPGFLRRSIKHTSRVNKRTGGALVMIRTGTIRKNEAFYGSFLDKGTKKIRARRFFKDKYFKNVRSIESKFAKEIIKRINKA